MVASSLSILLTSLVVQRELIRDKAIQECVDLIRSKSADVPGRSERLRETPNKSVPMVQQSTALSILQIGQPIVRTDAFIVHAHLEFGIQQRIGRMCVRGRSYAPFLLGSRGIYW